MNKKLAPKHWSTIMILVISGLILVFSLLGRFMNSSEQQPPPLKQQQPMTLTKIDFGANHLVLGPLTITPNTTPEWRSVPSSLLSRESISKLASKWLALLSTPQTELKKTDIIYLPRATVLLYFKGVSQPVIAKVETASISNRPTDILITFVSTGHKIILENILLHELVPE